MRKGISFRKLGRDSAHRYAMMRNMAASLIEHERIVTTTAKAKTIQRLAEKLITVAKKPDAVHARREINKVLYTDSAATKLLNVLAPRYQLRQGGYTRVLKLSQKRAGDNADMALIEYVDRPGEVRAARPPAMLQTEKDLSAVLSALGLSDDDAVASRGGGEDDHDADSTTTTTTKQRY